MRHAATLVLVLALAVVAGCKRAERSNTAVLGGNAQVTAPTTPATGLADAQGRAIPAPPVPPLSRLQVVRSGDEQALAAWVQDGHVVASAWSPAAGWTQAQPLERIYGESSDVQVASNNRGQAMVVWHHRVGNIHSLRFSRLGPEGWSLPDVVPGALPRPATPGTPPEQDATKLQMDAQGNVVAKWPSGFHAGQDQEARYAPGTGWAPPASEPAASAPIASTPSPAPSSAR
jgi:hypothetical protein